MKLPQFRLRSLFIAILLLAIMLAEAAEILRLRRMNATLQQQKAVAEQEKAAAEREYSHTQSILDARNVAIRYLAEQWEHRIESEKKRAAEP